jgi:hypothetical protein
MTTRTRRRDSRRVNMKLAQQQKGNVLGLAAEAVAGAVVAVAVALVAVAVAAEAAAVAVAVAVAVTAEVRKGEEVMPR